MPFLGKDEREPLFLEYGIDAITKSFLSFGHLLTSRVGRLCLLSGAVSAAAWTGAFLLGALPVLNNKVGFSILVAIWAAFVLVAYLSARGFIVLFGHREPRWNVHVHAEKLSAQHAREAS